MLGPLEAAQLISGYLRVYGVVGSQLAGGAQDLSGPADVLAGAPVVGSVEAWDRSERQGGSSGLEVGDDERVSVRAVRHAARVLPGRRG